MFRKICIYGVGAIGGWLAARLAPLPGLQITAVARGATLDALQRQGIALHEKDATGVEQAKRQAIGANSDPAALGPQDLVIVAVKGPALADVAARIAPLLAPHTVVLTAMNGVPWWFLQGAGAAAAGQRLRSIDPHGAIEGAIPLPHVVGCVVHASCSLDGPGVVRHRMGNELIVGEPSGEMTQRLQGLRALLRQAGFEVTASPQIQKEIWYKLWGNMTINPMCALTGATADRILDDDLARDFASRVMLEAQDIGARLGLPIADSPDDRHAVTRKLGALKPSMLQDVQAGRALELDALVSSVRELGQLTGVATPFTDALLGLARVHARQLGLYPA